MSDTIRRVFQRLAALELWVVAALAVAAIGSEWLLPVALGAAVLFWPIRWLAFRRLSVRTPIDWPLLLLVALVPVTLWATAMPDTTRPQVLRLLGGIALFYATVNWANSAARLRLAANGLLLASLALAAAAPFIGGVAAVSKVAPIASLASRLPPALTDAVNANVMAGTLAVLLPLPLALLLAGGRRLRWFEVGLALAAAIALLGMTALTQSRGAWMGSAAALVVLIALRWRWGWLAAPLALLGSGLATWRIGFQRVGDLIISSDALAGLDGRIEIWSRALYMIQDFSFTGVGMGNFGPVANLLYPFFLIAPDPGVPHAHNIFLQVAVDLGLPGLIAWLAALLVIVVAAWQVNRRARSRGDQWSAGLAAGLLAGQVALLIHGLTDAVTWGTRPAVVVWALWGLVLAAFMSSDQASAENSTTNFENSSEKV